MKPRTHKETNCGVLDLSSRAIEEIAVRTAELIKRAMSEDAGMATDELVSVRQAANLLGVAPVTMRRHAEEFPHVVIHGRLFFRKSGIEKLKSEPK